MNRIFLAAICASLTASTALADVITKRDGSTVTGKIVQEDADVLVLQSNVDSLIMRTKVARKDVADIKRDARADHSFCRIPIEGQIGVDVKAESLATALAQARSLKADTVILCFDSGGGRIAEMVKIIDLLKENKDLHFIAHVKNAQSAAALIALTCPRIIVTSGGSIGACVPYKLTPEGTPQDLEAKYLSYFEAIARSAAETGGHSPLLVRGMIEMNLVLSIAPIGTKKQIVEGEIANGEVLKKAGQILTLQGQEAVNTGLACGLADDLVANPSLAGIKSWASAGDAPWSYMKSRQNAGTDSNAQIASIRSKIETQLAAANQARETAANLLEQAKREMEAANDDYARAARMNRMPSEIEPARKKATQTRDDRFAAIKKKYGSLIDAQKHIYDAAEAEIKDLAASLQRLATQH